MNKIMKALVLGLLFVIVIPWIIPFNYGPMHIVILFAVGGLIAWFIPIPVPF